MLTKVNISVIQLISLVINGIISRKGIMNNRYYFDFGYELFRYDRHRFVIPHGNETLQDAMIRVNQERIMDQNRIRQELKKNGYLTVKTLHSDREFLVTEKNINQFL